MVAERGIARAIRGRTRHSCAVVQIVVHPAVVVVLVFLAALGIGHHVFELLPIVGPGQPGVFDRLLERQGWRPCRARAGAPCTQQEEQVLHVDGAADVEVSRAIGAVAARPPRAQQEEEVFHVDGTAAIEVRRADIRAGADIGVAELIGPHIDDFRLVVIPIQNAIDQVKVRRAFGWVGAAIEAVVIQIKLIAGHVIVVSLVDAQRVDHKPIVAVARIDKQRIVADVSCAAKAAGPALDATVVDHIGSGCVVEDLCGFVGGTAIRVAPQDAIRQRHGAPAEELHDGDPSAVCAGRVVTERAVDQFRLTSLGVSGDPKGSSAVDIWVSTECGIAAEEAIDKKRISGLPTCQAAAMFTGRIIDERAIDQEWVRSSSKCAATLDPDISLDIAAHKGRFGAVHK